MGSIQAQFGVISRLITLHHTDLSLAVTEPASTFSFAFYIRLLQSPDRCGRFLAINSRPLTTPLATPLATIGIAIGENLSYSI